MIGRVGKRIVALMLVVPMVLSVACNKDSEKSKKSKEKDKQEVDITECVSVSARGYDGMGVVNCQKDSTAINKIFKDIMKEQYGDEVDSETKKAFNKLEESISFQAEPSGELSNGDEVTIKITCNSKYADTCGVKLSPSSFKYTVNGLDTIQKIDAFDGLQVSFSGTETETGVIVDNTQCSDFVRNYVNFHVEDKKESYKNGESLIVKAEFGDNLPADYDGLYMLSETERGYTVDGLDMYPATIDNLDVTEVVKATYEKGLGYVANKIYNELSTFPEFNGTGFYDDSSRPITISDFNAVPEKMYYLAPKSNTDGVCKIVVLFHLTYHVSGHTYSYGTGPMGEQSIDTYFAAGTSDFVTDSTQTILKSTGESFMVGDSDDESYLCNDHTYEAGYNAFIAMYAEDYVINELDIATYSGVFEQE